MVRAIGSSWGQRDQRRKQRPEATAEDRQRQQLESLARRQPEHCRCDQGRAQADIDQAIRTKAHRDEAGGGSNQRLAPPESGNRRGRQADVDVLAGGQKGVRPLAGGYLGAGVEEEGTQRDHQQRPFRPGDGAPCTAVPGGRALFSHRDDSRPFNRPGGRRQLPATGQPGGQRENHGESGQNSIRPTPGQPEGDRAHDQERAEGTAGAVGAVQEPEQALRPVCGGEGVDRGVQGARSQTHDARPQRQEPPHRAGCDE